MTVVEPPLGATGVPPITTELPETPIGTPFTVTVGEEGFPFPWVRGGCCPPLVAGGCWPAVGVGLLIGLLVGEGFPDGLGSTGEPTDVEPKTGCP